MEFDINSLIMMLLSGTTVGGIVSAIWYRKQNKTIKNSEATKASVEAQKAQIQLGELFTQKAADMFKKMEEMQEQTYNAILKNGTDNESIIKEIEAVKAEQKRQAEELKRLADEQKRQADEQSHIVAFVNGEYQDFLAKNGFKKKK